VTGVSGEFIGCTSERQIGSDERQTWDNLRFIERITIRTR
jgi:hypothetical protein